MKMKSAVLLLTLLVAACGGGGSGGDPDDGRPGVGSAPVTADISLLFMGNSHTTTNDLPDMIVAMIRSAKPQQTVGYAVAPGFMFLEDRVRDRESMDLLRGQSWSFVILQAQKYSTSGQFEYSTEEAVELIRMSRQQSAVPIMFPEWPRAGVDETQRIYDLHVSIAQRAPACVAPVGQAWELSFASPSRVPLHQADGNHSNPAGAFLTALILFNTITGVSPLDVPPLPQFPVTLSTQEFLRGIADETVRMLPPRFYCPSDPFP